MRSCKEYEAQISAFLDGELSEEERAEMAEHLAVCPACQRYFDDLVAIHDAFDLEEAPVPEGFAESVMARVREMPQEEPDGDAKKIIRFPYWRQWAAMAACCALAALGLWSFQARKDTALEASLTAVAQSAPSIAMGSAALPETGKDGLIALADEMDEAVPAEAEGDAQAECGRERKLWADDAAGGDSDGAEMPVDGAQMEDAMPAPAAGDFSASKEEPSSGTITAGGDAARAWVEEALGLAWEPGRAYLLTEEEYAGLLETLALAEEDYTLEPGEGFWLLAG